MGFFLLQAQHQPMSRVAANTISHNLWHRTVLAIAVVAFPAALFADIPSALQQPASETCYCHCHEAAARRGCTKMCDVGRHAAAWLASSCAKPRFQPPHDKSGAGPHFRQSPRAEHAEVRKQFLLGKQKGRV